MLTHQQLRALRARIHELSTEACSDPVGTELATIALELLACLERASTSEVQLPTTMVELVAACRAAVASDRLGEPRPLVHVEHQLSAHGWTPDPRARPAALLAEMSALNGPSTARAVA